MVRVAFPGRFQPLHRGHHRVIQEFRTEYDEFVLALGSPEKARTPRNPLTAAERERIVAACFPDVAVVRVPDEDRGDAGYPTWARRLVDLTGADVVVSRNDLVVELVERYTDAVVVPQPLFSPRRFSGTVVRERIRRGQSWRPFVPECCQAEVASLLAAIRDAGDP
ncbi:MAG: adenylyltransferase/cytidyltransferase family protein [Halanaeroarchaeum sp.]